MSSETKGTGQRWPQPIMQTLFKLQNGLQDRGYSGQHLDGHQADIHTCGPKQAKSPCNRYNHPRAADPRGHLRLHVARRSCQADLMSVLWNRPMGNGLQHNRVSVNYSLTECSFVARKRQTEPHLSLRKCVLDAPAQFRGHGNCRPPVFAVDRQSGSVRKAPNVGMIEREFNSTLCTANGKQDLNWVHKVMFSTKDHNTTNQQIRHWENVAQTGSDGPGQTWSSKRSQRVIQDQIQTVVVNLEEVLHGLKKIHLEMKEVVRQIDLLTEGIDINEDDPGGAMSSTFERRRRESDSPRCTPNKTEPHGTSACPIRDQTQPFESTQEMVSSQRRESRTASRQREQKPPPYPYSSTTGRVNAKAKGQKAPPYPFRRRLLSTIV